MVYSALFLFYLIGMHLMGVTIIFFKYSIKCSRIKRGGMLVVSFWGINFGFWSHLGFYGQNAVMYDREGLL